MKDKFSLDLQTQRELLLDNFERFIHVQAMSEGIDCTLPQTKEILLYGRSSSLSTVDTNTILGLNRAWRFIITGLTESGSGVYNEVGFRTASFMHYLLMSELLDPSAVGRVRVNDVRISGTNWRPKLPNVYTYDNELLNLAYRVFSNTEYALEVFCLIARTQAFIDGNKRTAFLVANLILSRCGNGYLEVPLTDTFRSKLLAYYESGDNSDLKSYLYRYWIKGV